MKLPRGILLDLDDTLYGNYVACNEAGERAACAFLSAELGEPLDALFTAYVKSREEVHARLGGTASGHSRFLYLKGCIERITDQSHIILCRQAEHLFWQQFLHTMVPRHGLASFFDKATNLACRIAIVSDLTVHTQAMKLEELGVVSYVDVLITSEETGHDKPHHTVFELALGRLRLRPEDAVMIGDSYEKDICGARVLGIRGILMGDAGVRNTSFDIEHAADFHELSGILFP